MNDIDQEAIKKTIESGAVHGIRISRGDELFPDEILIFCGSAAHRKYLEIKSQINRQDVPVAEPPKPETKQETSGLCIHDWDENLVCKKCGKDV